MTERRQITFTKEHRAKAKELDVPLVAIAFDDFHCSQPRHGGGSFVGPSRVGEEVYQFLLNFIKRNNEAVEAAKKPKPKRKTKPRG